MAGSPSPWVHGKNQRRLSGSFFSTFWRQRPFATMPEPAGPESEPAGRPFEREHSSSLRGVRLTEPVERETQKQIVAPSHAGIRTPREGNVMLPPLDVVPSMIPPLNSSGRLACVLQPSRVVLSIRPDEPIRLTISALSGHQLKSDY